MRGASEAAVTLLTLGADSSRISALYVLRQIMLHRAGRTYFKIAGGMDRLPQVLAAPLKDAIHYNAEVLTIAQSEGGVELRYRQNGEERTATGARAIVTLPFSALRRIAIAPALSPLKRAAISGMVYRPVTRFLLQTETPVWRARGLSGVARTDAPAELWDGAANQQGPQGLLSVTAGGSGRTRAALAGASETERIRAGLTLAAQAFPDIAAAFQRGFTKDWSEDPWSGGGFAVFYPGQMTQWGSAIWRTEGRLHFAGEHTSPWPGWMEGALWSAERAFQEILA
jgi:monoamine oxidase